MDGARDGLYEHGDIITDQHLADRILREVQKGLPDDLPDECECVRDRSYNQRNFGLEDAKRILRNIYADNLIRTDSRGKSVVGRGVAMHAQGDSSRVQRLNCSEHGHYKNECLPNNDSKKRGDN